MLCSVSVDKPGGSTWLDRLRSRKGLPTGDNDDLGLDHFLRINHHSVPDASGAPVSNGASETPKSPPNQLDRERVEIPKEDKGEEQDGEWYGVMSNVLSELFNFGGSHRSSTISRKKFPRKQTNPSHCSVQVPNSLLVLEGETKSTFDVTEAENFNSHTATDSLNSDNKKSAETKERRNNNVECVEEEEEERGDRELLGYSRSEVTVIDTSFEIWKFDKLVFRRKNLWKARDKKGKSRVVGKKKKRKGDVVPDTVEKNKKPKFSTSESHNDHAQKHRRQIEEISEDMETDASQVPKRRQVKILRLKSRKQNSSRQLIKSIPTSKTNSGTRPDRS